MFYGDDLVEEVRSRNDIVDVISGYINLKKQGSNYFGLCPFHNEKSPSFSVTPSKQMFYCFGCGEGGNVFSFVMKYDNCSFSEAMQTLAQKAGVSLPEVDMSEGYKKEQSVRARILEVNKAAAKYYYAMLRNESGKLGYDYLAKRGLSKETMQQFGLGYASQGASLYHYLRNQGFDEEIIRESGLMNVDERRGMTDKFWNRVIFPIMDVNNRVIGFGGRVMGDAKPKYLNSPETKVFDKSRNLYGLNRARSSRKNCIIVCEGYMDVIAMHQAGFDQAVASLGTAFTSGHAALLKRYTKEVLLMYDSDDAGIKAALRAIPICKEVGLLTRVVSLAPYKDPDEFIGALGAEEFQKRLDEAENAFYFEIRMLERDYNMSDPESSTRFQLELSERLAHIENEIERENYIRAMASKYLMNEQVLRNAVVKAIGKMDGIREIARPKEATRRVGLEKDDGITVAQKLLLTWIVDEPEVFDQVSRYIEPEDYEQGMLRTVATALYSQLSEGKLNPSAIVSLFDEEEEHRQVASIFNTKLQAIESASEREKAITELVVKIKSHALSKVEVDSVDPLAAARNKRTMQDEIKKIHITL